MSSLSNPQQEQLWACAFASGQAARETLASNAHWPIIRQELCEAFASAMPVTMVRAKTRAMNLGIWALAQQDLTWAAEAFVESLHTQRAGSQAPTPTAIRDSASRFQQAGIAWTSLHVASAVLCATRLSMLFEMTGATRSWCEPERDEKGNPKQGKAGPFHWALICLHMAVFPSAFRPYHKGPQKGRTSVLSVAEQGQELPIPVRHAVLAALSNVEKANVSFPGASWPSRLVEFVNDPQGSSADFQTISLDHWQQLQDEHRAVVERQILAKTMKRPKVGRPATDERTVEHAPRLRQSRRL